MARFHINPATGGISKCRAESQPCPFGGESGSENHFNSIAEAKVGYEQVMKHVKIPTHSRQDQEPADYLDEPEIPDSPELALAKERFSAAMDKWKALDDRFKRGADHPNFKFTRTWYQLVQERKNAFYDMRVAYENRNAAFPEEERARREAEKMSADQADAERLAAWRAKKEKESGPYNYHPEIKGAAEGQAQKAISAFSGMSEEEVLAKVEAEEASGLSKTEAFRKVWAEAPMRSDKPMVMLDLEVAAPMIRNRVDSGPYSSIIEVGYIKRWPDGRTEEDSYLCGVPANLHETEGTGAEHIHNISPDMVKGLTPFTEDTDRQRKLLQVMKGSVLVAHNANYETQQFSHNLPGFNSAMDRGHIEVLDTMQVVKNFMPETPNNTNKSFVEANGDSYEGAHRALDDAKMTMRALFKHKGIDE